jgi:hypothetical protein
LIRPRNSVPLDPVRHLASAGLISAQVAALTEGVLKTMLFTKLKVSVLLVVAALGGATGLIYRTLAAESLTPQAASERADEKPGKQPKGPSTQPEGRIWLLEDRSDVATIQPDGNDHRVLLKGQKMLRWVSPTEKLIWFDGKDGRLPDPLPALQPDGNPKRDGLTVHVKPFSDKTANARQNRQISQLIADLDSDRFAKREKANQSLADFGELAEPAMREALAGKPSAEVRQRLQKLLGALALKATDLGVPSADLSFVARDGHTLVTRGYATRDCALLDAVTKKRTPLKLPSEVEWALDLAPDESWVLALASKEGLGLHKVPLDGGRPVLLTGRLYTSLGRISPDGKQVLATVYENAVSDLYLIDVATQKATKVSGPGHGKHVWSWGEWSPDGRHLACAWGERFNGGQTMVAVCDADGRDARFILTTEKSVVPIAWR